MSRISESKCLMVKCVTNSQKLSILGPITLGVYIIGQCEIDIQDIYTLQNSVNSIYRSKSN